MQELAATIALAPCYRDVARQEAKGLQQKWPNILSHIAESIDDYIHDGVLLAYLHLINQRCKTLGITRVDLASRFADLNTQSAVSKWFSTGEISSSHFAFLMWQEEFLDIRPLPEDALVHGYRKVITWIRLAVLGDTSTTRPLKWLEYEFLCHTHAVDESDLDHAFEQLPVELKREYSRFNATSLVCLMREWGKAYRLFCLSMEATHD